MNNMFNSTLRVFLLFALIFGLTRDAFCQECEKPRGIYLLGSLGQSNPDAVALAKPFVDGYTLRVLWETLEPQRDVVDFSVIDGALAALAPFGGAKKLTLELFSREVPSWVLAEPGVITYEAKPIGAAGQGSATITLPVPWDEFTLTRWEAFVTQVAAHTAFDPATGTLVPLSQHSLLSQITAEIPGIGGIRDQGNLLINSGVYNRTLFLGSINRAVNATEDRFPNAFVFLLYFNMNDGQNPPLNTTILSNLRTEFFPSGQPPRLGLFKENFSCNLPVGQAGDALFDSQDETFIMLQALQAWVGPFLTPENTDDCLVFSPPLADGWQTGNMQTDNVTRLTAISGPEVGMMYGLNTFDCRYFELYVNDLRQASFEDDFTAMHNLIWSLPCGDAGMSWVLY